MLEKAGSFNGLVASPGPQLAVELPSLGKDTCELNLPMAIQALHDASARGTGLNEPRRGVGGRQEMD
jgi:hypothetical protein